MTENKNKMVNITYKKIDWTNPEEIKEYKKEWEYQNRDRLRIEKKEYGKNNREKIISYSKKWREQNKEKKKILDKQYKSRPEIKKKILAQERERYNKNRDKILKQAKKYRENNKDKIDKYKEINKDKLKSKRIEYYKNNKDKMREKSKKYREDNKNKMKKIREDNKDKLRLKSEKYNRLPKVIKHRKEKHEKSKKAICIICGNPAHIKYCSDKCFGIGNSGKNNSNWKGGPKIYSIEWNNTFKKMIRDRDANFCMVCNRHRDEFNRALDVHHIDGNPKNTIEENCITLCPRHHQIIEHSGNKKYTFWMPKFRKILSDIHGYEYEEEVLKI